ncbi:hypothetical protein VPNG_01494 [Cytospora leucostoma]|uniref:Rab-GAP TBC domain-containing protein n=1 Tax=Cytospora leucostoma TaxID=1230097 RepID=A0A423XKC1_9PEZI|nr:hypothetical protein VPNG_01494 [Cytospora leucostoma]
MDDSGADFGNVNREETLNIEIRGEHDTKDNKRTQFVLTGGSGHLEDFQNEFFKDLSDWDPTSPRPRQRRDQALLHTDPLDHHHHFNATPEIDPKQTAVPAPRQPNLAFSPFSPTKSRFPFFQRRKPSQTYEQHPADSDQAHDYVGNVSNEPGSTGRSVAQPPYSAIQPQAQPPIPFNGAGPNRPFPITPTSPKFAGSEWESLPSHSQDSFGNETIAGIAETADVPIAPDPIHPPYSIRSPQSATFSIGLYSHPLIPEDQSLDFSSDPPGNSRHEHAPAVTSGQTSKMYRPDSRQSGETAYSPSPEKLNFSRPRKPSLASLGRVDGFSATHLRPGTAKTSISESARGDSRTAASNHMPYNPGSRAGRHPSVASNMSTSSYASAAPDLYHKSSYDRLGPYRNVSQNAAAGNYMGLPHIVPQQSPQLNRLGPYAQQQQSPYLYEDELRSSMRSQLTSSSAQDTLFTDPERASLMTRRSSVFSNRLMNRRSSFFGPLDPTFDVRESLSVDDVMGLYEQGFNDSASEISRRLSSVDPDVPVVRLAPGRMNDHDDSRPGSAVSHSSEAASRLLEAMSQSNSMAVPGRSFPLNADGSVTIRDTNAFFRRSLASSLPNDMRFSFIQSEGPEPADGILKADIDNLFETDSGGHNRHDSGKEVGPRNEEISPIEEVGPFNEDISSLEEVSPMTEEASPMEEIGPRNEEIDPLESVEQPDEAMPLRDDVLLSINKETLAIPLSPALAEMREIHPLHMQPVQGAPQPEDLDPNANDRYGFRKQNQYITREQYDEWNGPYTEYLARRKKKWETFLKENGLMTDKPNRFPQHSAKAKRFVRKGIPPEWRGAAWFYYAGGPKILANNRGVYDKLLKQVEAGDLKEVCREDIERDLYRTFPDNVRFRRKATTALAGEESRSPSPAHSRNHSTQSANPTPRASDPTIIASLRRVLSAFAIFNPTIGYCQSLNFLGGMLLLFVETEEQAFWLLNIITRVYLPGTHEMSLEGSKVDLSVLMNELEAVLPNVWNKISDDGSGTGKRRPKRGRNHRQGIPSVNGENLPPVTLALTAWFMSCFIGTLPIETTLRVWDVFFYEGSKTLFRVALAIFKVGENEIKAISDPMEVFAVVQSLPRKMLDANALLEATFKRRSGLNHLTSEALDQQRAERKEKLHIQRKEAVAAASASPGIATAATIAVSRARKTDDMMSINSGDSANARRKHALFTRRNKDRGQSDV